METLSPAAPGAALSLAEAHNLFVHVRIIIGMILGIAVTRLVTGLARVIQHPAREGASFVHLAWAAFTFLLIIHFWWFEFALAHLRNWDFLRYLLLICYALGFVLVATLLFPDRLTGYDGFDDYFRQRRRWFYGVLLFVFLIDIPDTALKGWSYYHALYGWWYPLRQGALIGGALGALTAGGRRYDRVFVTLALLLQVAWVALLFRPAG